MSERDWGRYLASFHGERAGITEDVLEHAVDSRGWTPYDWAAAPVPARASVVDLACGSGPMAGRLADRPYIGLDLSRAELAAAAEKGRPVAQADAARLPLRTASAEAVVMSMALMLVPLADTLAEVRRVLRPGGVLVATVPHNRPLPWRDRLRYGRLCLALRHPRLSYPNDTALRGASTAFAAAGLRLVEDEARPFVCHLEDAHVADQLLASMYLPDVRQERIEAGRRVVARWVGASITTPVRRLVATR